MKLSNSGRSASTKVVLTTCYVLYFLLVSIYTGLLVSSLTVEKTVLPKNIKELATKSDYTIGMTRGNSITELVRMSKNPDLMKITRRSISVQALRGTRDACRRYNYAYLTSVAMFKYRQKKIPDCKAVILPEVIYSDNYHFVTQKNNVLSKRLSYIMTRLVETGLRRRIGQNCDLENYRDHLDQKEGCKFMAITLGHFVIPISVLTIGIVLAFVSLTIEIIAKMKTRQKRK